MSKMGTIRAFISQNQGTFFNFQKKGRRGFPAPILVTRLKVLVHVKLILWLIALDCGSIVCGILSAFYIQI